MDENPSNKTGAEIFIARQSKKRLKRRMPGDEQTLTPRQKHFAEVYLANGGNASHAYRTAYNPRQGASWIANEAYELLRRPAIALMIEKAQGTAQERVEAVCDRYAVTQERIVEALAKLAFSEIRDVMAWTENGNVSLVPSEDVPDAAAYAVQEIAQTKDGVRVKMADKRAALIDLGKHLGMWQQSRDLSDDAPLQNRPDGL